jgi:hypothetical protein
MELRLIYARKSVYSRVQNVLKTFVNNATSGYTLNSTKCIPDLSCNSRKYLLYHVWLELMRLQLVPAAYVSRIAQFVQARKIVILALKDFI